MDYGECKYCKRKYTGNEYCKACNVKHFQQNFKNWTSGNNDIDKIFQDKQLSANFYDQVLEWIPYNKLYDIEYIAKGGFGKVIEQNGLMDIYSIGIIKMKIGNDMLPISL
uniref:Protein kinase domain-containing protein n=1 Tax=Rhizophagus irregularis (strain DAOM 181602 / DAOM 197198 / MUCL 43194) TaxID=747089 RepID=U9V0Z5_RHIID